MNRTTTVRLLTLASASGLLFFAALAPDTAAAQSRRGGDSASAQPRLSPKVVKPLQAASEHLGAERWAEAQAELEGANAIPDKTPYDQYVIDDLLGFALVRQQKFTEAALAYERTLESGFLAAEKVPDQLRLMSQLFFQSEPRNLEKSALYGSRYLAEGNPNDSFMAGLVAQGYYFTDRNAEAAEYAGRAIAITEAAGQRPEENWLQIRQSAFARQNDAAGARQATMALVRYYPSPERWNTLARTLLDQRGNTDRTNLHIFRLMAETEAMERPEEFTEAANVATLAGSPGEALRFLELGFSSKALASSEDREKLEAARKLAADDRKALPQFEREASGAREGEADVRLGEAFLSYDEVDKAIAAIERGIGKGGVRSVDDAYLLLGRAHLEADHGDEARAAWSKVQGEYAPIAELWNLYLASRAATD